MSQDRSQPSGRPMGRGMGGRPGGNVQAAMVSGVKAKNFGMGAKRIGFEMRAQRWGLYLSLLLALISVAASALLPTVIGRGIDSIFAGLASLQFEPGLTRDAALAQMRAQGGAKETLANVYSTVSFVPGAGLDYHALAQLLGAGVILAAFSSGIGWWQGVVVNRMVVLTVSRLRRQLIAKLNRVPMRYIDGFQRGELLSRVSNDVDNMQQTLEQIFSQVFVMVLQLLATLCLMIWISPLMALISVVTIPLSMWAVRVLMGRSKPHFTAQWKSVGEVNALVEEACTGHSLLTLFGRRAQENREFERQNAVMYQASFRASFISGLAQPVIQFFSNLNYVLIAVVGGIRVASGTMSLGDVQAFIQYSRQLGMPVSQIAALTSISQSCVASAERIFEVLDAEEEDLLANGTAGAWGGTDPGQGRLAGEVEFRNVSFAYDPARPLIQDFNLHVKPGQTVAIVGPTGAGKTTLTNLLMRFYDVQGGQILLDGVDVRSYPRRELRRHFGMVLQDPWIFHGSIYENIAYGATGSSGSGSDVNDPVTRDLVMQAARAASVDHFVQALPEGYDTLLRSDESVVSVGQKQLLTIARAFMAQPEILLLDEATSSVDTRTEVQIQTGMRNLRSERTSFVIAHRLSTIRDADVIVVMRAGGIVEQGTHEQLLGRRGAYFELYQAQFMGGDQS